MNSYNTEKLAAANRRKISFAAYTIVAIVSYWSAFLLRFEFHVDAFYTSVFVRSLVLLIGTRLLAAEVFGLTTVRWRFIGTQDIRSLVYATTGSSLAFLALCMIVPLPARVPYSVLLIDWILNGYLIAASWILYRTAFERRRHSRAENLEQRRVLIIGAGEAGYLLARDMSRVPVGRKPVGFVDDDNSKWGTTVHGLAVFGGIDRVDDAARVFRADELAITIPSATPGELRRIVEKCEALNLPIRILPGMSQMLIGEVRANQLRELQIEDLLGREPITLALPELFEELNGQVVLITGAAGSIGSELSRQVALHGPSVLVLFDQSETGLFYLEKELLANHPDLHIATVIGDIVDATAVERVFRLYRPTRVYHAAAYKHVPMMQVNLREAVRNNTLGTMRVADAAGRFSVAKFVLVSTDKAVQPTSVMGGSKRLAEIVVLEQQRKYPETAFACVRFGNVLGSSGSVIPIFKEQIETGRPLTVTHPEATRYFMTIPEAVQLILQASLLPEVRGRIAMLDMGEPIKILDLAKNMLRLSGLPVKVGKNIVFTGLRSGEKLHEELSAPDETTTPTGVAKIRLVAPSTVFLLDVNQTLSEWEEAFCEGNDAAVHTSLAGMFPELEIDQPTITRPSLQGRRVKVSTNS